MRSAGVGINRDIGENGRQPTDYAASLWEELKRESVARPLASARTYVGANSNSDDAVTRTRRS